MAKEYIEKEAALAIIARKQNNSLNDVVVDACGQLYAETNSLPTQEDTSDTHLLDMLLEAINYVYKQLDGKYGNLSYVVSDKVKYIERVRAEKIEKKKREEYEARERGEAKPEADVNKWVVTNAFLHCAQAGKIVSEMYGDKLNNLRNRDKYIAFLQQVNLDDRFGELAEILQRYGVMPAPKEQPEADLEAVKDAYCDVCGHFHHTTPHHICRLDCRYYTDFINRLNSKNK